MDESDYEFFYHLGLFTTYLQLAFNLPSLLVSHNFIVICWVVIGLSALFTVYMKIMSMRVGGKE